jgi:hypothetical protein
MFTHPETLCTLNDLDLQERLRLSAQERLTAAAHAGERLALPIARTAGRFAPSWLSGMLRRWRSAERVESVDPSPRHGFAMQSAGKISCGFWTAARCLA